MSKSGVTAFNILSGD